LHPSILEDLGLSAALTELCEEFTARKGIEVKFEQKTVPRNLPVSVASCLYRVTQEALHNVVKHARTDYAQVEVKGNSNGIHLHIHDTGVGFDSDAGMSRASLGIVSMKERVRLVNGEFSIRSKAGEGTDVTVFVPLKEHREAPNSIAG
jgi:signal transduction histidine kinase